MRLAIITTHPIQYYAPVFRLLAKQMAIRVYYTWGEEGQNKFDPGFGKTIAWDIPLLDGYFYEWVKNTSPHPGSHHFKGIINPGLLNRIIDWRADAILVYGWAYDSHLKTIRHFNNKIPVYFRGDSTLLDEKTGAQQMFRSAFLRWVYSHISHAFYAGSNNEAYFRKFGVKKEALTFAPHAIDNERFAIDRTVDSAKIRMDFGIRPTDKMILFAGKLEEKKSPQLLLNAFLNLNMPDTHLLFTGNGALATSLKTAATQNRNIHFLTFQNQSIMPAIYQASDLFCLPSRGPGETWGLAVNEAMAAARPVLVSDKCGCAKDLVKPGITGEIFEASNLNDITAKLRLLMSDPDRLTALGNHAKNHIASWNFCNQANAILKRINSDYAC